MPLTAAAATSTSEKVVETPRQYEFGTELDNSWERVICVPKDWCDRPHVVDGELSLFLHYYGAAKTYPNGASFPSANPLGVHDLVMTRSGKFVELNDEPDGHKYQRSYNALFGPTGEASHSGRVSRLYTSLCGLLEIQPSYTKFRAFIREVCLSANKHITDGIPSSLTTDHLAQLLEHLGVSAGSAQPDACTLLNLVVRFILLLLQTAAISPLGFPASTKLDTPITPLALSTPTACALYLTARANGDRHKDAVRSAVTHLEATPSCLKGARSPPRCTMAVYAAPKGVKESPGQKAVRLLAQATAVVTEHNTRKRLDRDELVALFAQAETEFGAWSVSDINTERKRLLSSLPKKAKKEKVAAPPISASDRATQKAVRAANSLKRKLAEALDEAGPDAATAILKGVSDAFSEEKRKRLKMSLVAVSEESDDSESDSKESDESDDSDSE